MGVMQTYEEIQIGTTSSIWSPADAMDILRELTLAMTLTRLFYEQKSVVEKKLKKAAKDNE